MANPDKTFRKSTQTSATPHGRLRGDLLDGAPARAAAEAPGAAVVLNDEALIVDERSALRPAQMVENKLSRMLKDASLPVSHLQMRGMIRAR